MIARDVFKLKHNNLRMQKIIDQSNLEVSIGLTLVSMFLYVSLFATEIELLLMNTASLAVSDKVFIASFALFLIAAVCLLVASLNFAFTSKMNTKELHVFLHLYVVATTIFCIDVFCYNTAKVYDMNVFLGTMVAIYCVLYLEPLASLSMLTLSFLSFYIVRYTPSFAIENTNWVEYLFVYFLLINISFWKYGRKVGIAEHMDALERTSRRDGLTSLKNRSAFRQNFNGYLGRYLNIMMVDLNDFKGVNDTFGHSVGDDLLSDYGKLFIEVFGDEWSYRYGGDEFMIIVPDMTKGDFEAVVDVWLQDLPNIKITNTNIHIGCSYGCASDKVTTPDDIRALIRLADARLYKEKKAVARKISLQQVDTSAIGKGTDSRPDIYCLHDELTSLLSYQGFMDQAQEYLSACMESGRACSIAFCKIDSFHDFNSCFGYSEGDRLVVSVAEKLQHLFPDALVARIGVAKFAILAETSEITQKSLELHNFVSRFKNNSSLFLRIGCYNFTDSTTSLTSALDWAKMALMSMNGRRDKYICDFDSSMLVHYEVSDYILKNIREALQNKLIDVLYQPIYDTSDHKCVALEAKVLWNTREFGAIDTHRLVSVLEASYLIEYLDLYVLEHALDDINTLSVSGIALPVCINVSRLNSNTKSFVDTVISKTNDKGIDPKQICFGITNTNVAYNKEELLQGISRLKDEGFNVWMNDCGCGYSNLFNACCAGFDVVKFNLDCMNEAPDNCCSEILNLVLVGCEELGLKSVIEGVDDSSSYKWVNDLNASYAQGKYCCEPVDINSLHHILKDL